MLRKQRDNARGRPSRHCSVIRPALPISCVCQKVMEILSDHLIKRADTTLNLHTEAGWSADPMSALLIRNVAIL